MPLHANLPTIESAAASTNDARAPLHSEGLLTLENLRERGSLARPDELIELWETLAQNNLHEQTPYVKASFIAFGLYDTWRVADPTAHAVLDVLHAQLHGLLAGKDRQRYSEAQQKLKDPFFMDDVREFVTALGPPSYHPYYMIEHGVGFFTGEHDANNGLQPGFEADKAWAAAINYLFSPLRSTLPSSLAHTTPSV